MAKSPINQNHPSSSSTQKQIEEEILKDLHYEPLLEDGFQIDGVKYFDESKSKIIELAEINTSLNPLDGSRRQKVVSDILKLLTYSFDNDKCKDAVLKILVTNEHAQKTLLDDTNRQSWIKDAIVKFKIKV